MKGITHPFATILSEGNYTQRFADCVFRRKPNKTLTKNQEVPGVKLNEYSLLFCLCKLWLMSTALTVLQVDEKIL